MKRYAYNQPTLTGGDEIIIKTEEEILAEYYPRWSEFMKKAGRSGDITPEVCIEDWITIHWAWELKNNES